MDLPKLEETDSNAMIQSLYDACKRGDLSLVEHLCQNSKFCPVVLGKALQAVCVSGHRKIVECLVDHYAFRKVLIDPIWTAAQYDHWEVVECLLSRSRDPTQARDRALQSASRYGHLDLVKKIVAEGLGASQPSTQSLTAEREPDPFIVRVSQLTACKYGHLQVFRYLDQFDVSSNWKENFYTACERGHTTIVQYLIDNGRVDWSNVKITGLRDACLHEHLETVEYMISLGVEQSTLGAVFSDCCRRGRVRVVQYLLAIGISRSTMEYCRDHWLTPTEVKEVIQFHIQGRGKKSARSVVG